MAQRRHIISKTQTRCVWCRSLQQLCYHENKCTQGLTSNKWRCDHVDKLTHGTKINQLSMKKKIKWHYVSGKVSCMLQYTGPPAFSGSPSWPHSSKTIWHFCSLSCGTLAPWPYHMCVTALMKVSIDLTQACLRTIWSSGYFSGRFDHRKPKSIVWRPLFTITVFC